MAPSDRGLHHILLEVRDLPASERFYLGVLGFSLRRREPFRDGRPFLTTQEGLGLVQAAGEQTGLTGHLAFRLPDVPGLVEAVKQAGHRVLRPLGPGPYGSTAYVADPDGNEVELIAEEAP